LPSWTDYTKAERAWELDAPAKAKKSILRADCRTSVSWLG